MAASNVRQELIPPEENIEMKDQQAPEDTEEFEDVKLDKTFWQKVCYLLNNVFKAIVMIAWLD